MLYHRLIVDLTETFKGHSQSITYLDGDIERVMYSSTLHNQGNGDLTLNQYLSIDKHKSYSVLTESVFDKLNEGYYSSLVSDAQEITREEYLEQLEVLPPENWVVDGRFEHFRMCEYYSGPITQQYARLDDKHLTKRIDVTNKSTWINPEHF